jgi:hypothetical protein
MFPSAQTKNPRNNITKIAKRTHNLLVIELVTGVENPKKTLFVNRK